MREPNTKIGVTLYNVREACKSPEGLDQSLGKISEIGYRAVQVSGVALPAEIIREKLDKYDLFPCASHERLPDLRTDFSGVVRKLKILGCDFTALGSPGEAFSTDPGAAGRLIWELDEYGRRFADEGIRFGYHNHNFEFQRCGEKLFLERLYDETDPATFLAEIDVHWVQRGGQNPAGWIRRVGGRQPVCHFKDYAMLGREPQFCEIGEGNLNWAEIIKACEETGVRWYVFEQDTPRGDRDIFESIRISYENLQAMGVE